MRNTLQNGVHPLSALVFFSWVLAVQLTGLAAFTKGFFLTRVELGRRSQCDIQSLLSEDELQHLSEAALRQQQQEQNHDGTSPNAAQQQHQRSSPSPHPPLDGCWLPPRFKRVVWVVVDALRYDFAAFSPPDDDGGGGAQSKLHHSSGAKHYLNHLPVISEAIGGPSNSNDDGPSAAFESYPFPSFNTRDLHTVDDGVLSHLSDELAKRDWDVLVAHFLGVDHVGHTFGPASQAMEDKLVQINAALKTVFDSVDNETIVFVLGDHGMTEDGNHGGATPEETGAALLVWSRSGERLLGPGFLRSRQAAAGAGIAESKETEAGLAAGDAGSGDSGLLLPDAPGARGVWGAADGNGGGVDARAGVKGDYGSPGGGSDGSGGGGGGGGGGGVVGRRVAQIDLVPTISLLLGTPIPFGSLGGVIPEVFAGPYYDGGEERDGRLAGGGDSDEGDDFRGLERLCDALLVNSVQVWRYLSDYADVASMPKSDMLDLKELFLAARGAHSDWVRQREWQRIKGRHSEEAAPGDDKHGPASARELRRVCDMYRTFLDSSIGLGRSLWTQYDTSLMWWGLAVLLAATAALAFRVVASSFSGWASAGAAAASCYGASSGPLSLGASSVLVGAAASVMVAFLTDAVFGPAGGHVFSSKVALCSSLGVCVHYAQAILLLRAGGGDGRPPWAGGSSSSGLGGGGDVACAGTTSGGCGARTSFTGGLAALYCAGLFSNSFIEAEDDLHRFLGASSLLSLSVLLLIRGPASLGTGSGGNGGDGGDRLGTLLGLSPTSSAALYAALAAALLRAAAGIQDVAAGAGVSTEAAFGFARSLCPLPALWWLCRMARGGDGGHGEGRRVGGDGTEAGPAGVAVGSGLFPPAGRSLSRLGGGVKGALSGGASCGLCSDGVLQAASLAAIGAYWLGEAVGAGEGSPSAADAAAAAGSVPGGGQAGWSFGVLLPMRLLLPRVVYLLCLAGLLAALLRPAARRVKQLQQQQQQQHQRSSKKVTPQRGRAEAQEEEDAGLDSWEASSAGGRGEASSYARALADTAGGVVSHVLPVVVVLLGPGSPAVVALVAGACGCFLRGVSLAARGVSGIEAVPLGAVAVAWSVVGRAFFFLTGHHNQFSRLQYSSAFVGFDEFGFKIGGLLLFLNTFGTEILAALALPLAAAAAASASASASPSASGASQGSRRDPLSPLAGASGGGRCVGGDGGDGGDDDGGATSFSPTPLRGEEEYRHPTRSPSPPWTAAGRVLSAMDRLSALTLLLSSFRTFLSAANVSVQRGHLMLWAVFAPKFVFDATMQAVCGAAAVLAWAVVLVAHRAYFPGQRAGAWWSSVGRGSMTARKKAR
eukprot:g13781.t1